MAVYPAAAVRKSSSGIFIFRRPVRVFRSTPGQVLLLSFFRKIFLIQQQKS